MAQPGFMQGFYNNHRGVSGLLRRGEIDFGFTLEFELDGVLGFYSVTGSSEKPLLCEQLGWGVDVEHNSSLGFFTRLSELNIWWDGWSSTHSTKVFEHVHIDDLALHAHFDEPKIRDVVSRARAHGRDRGSSRL